MKSSIDRRALNLVVLMMALLLLILTPCQQQSSSPFLIHAFQLQSTSLHRRPVNTPLYVVWDPNSTPDDLVDFPTDQQRKVLTKESKKRLARKELPSLSLPDSENLGPFSGETLETLVDLLQQNELIQVRGVARDQPKEVFGTIQSLVNFLELQSQNLVAMISYKGHSTILYSPNPNLTDSIELRTSVGQKNTWTRRIKAPRDHRGQIIKEKPTPE